jgi:hypothetical protein
MKQQSMNAFDTISAWLKKNPFVFRQRVDGTIFTLIEMASGKQIEIDAAHVSAFRLTPHPQGLGDYLNLMMNSGKEIVLCHAGVAFSPSFTSTGPLPDAPPVSCLQDYYRLLGNLKEIMDDPTQRLATLTLFNVLISVLDGAREIGLDVGVEEEALDKLLTEFEARYQ